MKGFTLLEVIVAVSIALVITGFVIANYNNYNDRQQLRQAALTLKNNLRFAQNKSASGEKPKNSPCEQLIGWRVTFAAASYSMQAHCTDGLAQGDGDVTTFSLPNDVSFSPVPQPITFRVLARGTTNSSAVDIITTNQSYRYRISVSPGGDIQDGGFQ